MRRCWVGRFRLLRCPRHDGNCRRDRIWGDHTIGRRSQFSEDLNRGAETMETNQTAGTPRKLFVIFHGSFVFRRVEGNVQVLVTDMGEEHVYRAGSWLAETCLGKNNFY